MIRFVLEFMQYSLHICFENNTFWIEFCIRLLLNNIIIDFYFIKSDQLNQIKDFMKLFKKNKQYVYNRLVLNEFLYLLIGLLQFSLSKTK